MNFFLKKNGLKLKTEILEEQKFEEKF
jgi:hypothetical protein